MAPQIEPLKEIPGCVRLRSTSRRNKQAAAVLTDSSASQALRIEKLAELFVHAHVRALEGADVDRCGSVVDALMAQFPHLQYHFECSEKGDETVQEYAARISEQELGPLETSFSAIYDESEAA